MQTKIDTDVFSSGSGCKRNNQGQHLVTENTTLLHMSFYDSRNAFDCALLEALKRMFLHNLTTKQQKYLW